MNVKTAGSYDLQATDLTFKQRHVLMPVKKTTEVMNIKSSLLERHTCISELHTPASILYTKHILLCTSKHTL